MFKHFGQIFWGLLLVIVDFNIDHVDILPDFIGYILMAMGCGGLVTVSRRFTTARVLCWILAVLAVIGYAPMGRDVTTAFSLTHLAVDCTMMWFLLGGVMEFAAARHRLDLSARASSRRIAYIALTGPATLIALVAQDSHNASVLAVMFVLCALVLVFLILRLIYQVRHELAAGAPA
jgi:hypothetical protein